MNHTPQPTTGKHPLPTTKNDYISLSVHDLNRVRVFILGLPMACLVIGLLAVMGV